MISLDSVEKMLRDTGDSDSRPLGNDYIPPPVFDGTSAKPAPRPVAATVTTAAKPEAKNTSGAFRFADMVRADGTVDTDAVYRYGQVPSVQLSAELILQALSNLPADIPASARQIALKVTVGSLTQAAGIPVETVVADALLRHTRLSQFRDALAAEHERENEPLHRAAQALEDAIAAKQEELAAVGAALEARKAVLQKTHTDCEKQLTRLTEVLTTLQDSESAPTAVSYG